MTFFTAQRITPFALGYRATHRSGMRGAGRRVIDTVRARLELSPQQRANLYVSRMPTAVLGADIGF